MATKENRLYTCDNLYVLNGMNSESVDLVYLDPPFNSKRLYAAPTGSKAAGASFKDMWKWDDVNEQYLEKMVDSYPALVEYIESIEIIHSRHMMAYLTYMSQRIIEMHRVLKSTGSLYLHCDPTASHYLKVVLDRVFGEGGFRNEIAWCYRGGGVPKNAFARKHDVIFLYAKGRNAVFHPQYAPYSEASSKLVEGRGGVSIDNKERDLTRGAHMTDWWTDINSLQTWSPERTGFKTQKPLALLRRIIQTSSNKGDVVFDPFCGCATTLVAAEQLGRRWIGIDIEKKAVELVVDRLSGAEGKQKGIFKDFVNLLEPPARSDIKRSEPDSRNTREKLFREQDGACNACGVSFELRNLEVDHVIPRAAGGGDYYENYQLLCANCNRVKGQRPMEYLLDKIKKRQDLLRRRVTFGGKRKTRAAGKAKRPGRRA